MARPTLGYWAIRGLAQPIRLVLAQGGLDYEDRRFTVSQAADGCGALVALLSARLHSPFSSWDRSEWLSVKYEQGLDFPNVPCALEA